MSVLLNSLFPYNIITITIIYYHLLFSCCLLSKIFKNLNETANKMTENKQRDRFILKSFFYYQHYFTHYL